MVANIVGAAAAPIPAHTDDSSRLARFLRRSPAIGGPVRRRLAVALGYFLRRLVADAPDGGQ
jgi:hypothetical protein